MRSCVSFNNGCHLIELGFHLFNQFKLRAAAILHNVPCITTLQGAWAAVNGIESMVEKGFSVNSLQNYYSDGKVSYSV